jgi:uracil-xanthine permease
VAAFGWKLHGDGKTLAPGDVVAPDERLSWGRTAGLGAQHVVAMFGATFVFPLIMGLNPQLAIMMSGIATIVFLLIVNGKVPSYLGTSAAFVGGAAAVYAQGGTPQQVTGAILVAGVVLALVGVLIHFIGATTLTKVLPPVVTGAVVMLIGFNLAPVVANIYWPQDQWIALATMTVTILLATILPGFWGRVSVLLGLIFGYVVSWLADVLTGPITAFNAGTGEVDTHDRVNWDGVLSAPWFGFPPATDLANGVVGWHAPDVKLTFVLLMLPAVIALVAENAGHVKAVEEMTGADLDPMMGRAIAADGVGTILASSVGGSPTTTYAENIGVMASTRVYSTAAYYCAALVAILFGLSPKFGALVSAVPGGVLGGITVVLYGMIGLLGAKIWVENKVDFSRPINLVPVAAGIIIAIGDTSLNITDTFSLAGIAFGTIVTIVAYHLVAWLMPASMRDANFGTATIADPPGGQNLEHLGLADDYGLYGHRILGRTSEGHLIVEEQAGQTRTDDPGGRHARPGGDADRS